MSMMQYVTYSRVHGTGVDCLVFPALIVGDDWIYYVDDAVRYAEFYETTAIPFPDDSRFFVYDHADRAWFVHVTLRVPLERLVVPLVARLMPRLATLVLLGMSRQHVSVEAVVENAFQTLQKEVSRAIQEYKGTLQENGKAILMSAVSSAGSLSEVTSALRRSFLDLNPP